MSPRTEIAGPCLEQVEHGTLLAVLDQFGGFGRLYLVHRLAEDFHRDIVAPSLVFGRPVVLLSESSHECLRSWRVDQVVPNERPGAEEVALACSPCHRGIEAKP